MRLPKSLIQRKLSALLGGEVSFDRLSISPLRGCIDAHGVSVAGDDPAAPVLTVEHVRAEVAIAALLKGEVVVRSFTVTRPAVSIVRRPDGTTNLPRPPRDLDGDDAAAPPPDDGSTGDEDDAAPSRWGFDVGRVLVSDGQAHLRDQASGYHASLEGVNLELTRAAAGAAGGDGYDLALGVRSAARRDRPADLGAINAMGRLSGIADLRAVATAGLQATLDVGGRLRARLNSPASADLASRSADFDLDGRLDLAQLLLLLPAALPALAPLAAFEPRGLIELAASANYSAATGLRIPSLTLRGTDLSVRP